MSQQVSNGQQRDEINKDRLSSFLFTEGNLEIRKLSSIKQNVFYLETNDNKGLILKRHSKKRIIEQQWDFFQKIHSTTVIPFKLFPNGRKIIVEQPQPYYWTISQYIRGRKLNYNLAKDRDDALFTIRKFHRTATNIYVRFPIKREVFFVRWYYRLRSFKKTESLFLKYGFEKLYTDIVKETEKLLLIVSQYPWQFEEHKALRDGLWVHGDVASHNFIQRTKTYLIDFDLLLSTPQIYDYIQLGQRFLPYLNWDLEKLCQYRMVQESDRKKWLSSIAVPSDLLREWLHYLSNPSTTSVKIYLEQLNEEWLLRKDFIRNSQSIIK